MGLSTRRHRELLTTTAGPVALGSPAGYIVRPARRLLWPHLRLCRPPNGLWIIPSGCGTHPPAAEGPQFTLPVRSPHAVARTPVVPVSASDDVFSTGIAFAELAPARQPHVSRLR